MPKTVYNNCKNSGGQMKKKGKVKQQTTSSPKKKTRIPDVEETLSKIETKLKIPF